MPFLDDENKPWQPLSVVPEEAPLALKSWLMDNGSLTARLKEVYMNDFRVDVITHTWAAPTASERAFLGLSDNVESSIREVLLVCKGRPRVFARSVLPASSLHGANASLLKLGNKPLGEFLFTHPDMRRGHIEVANLPAKQFNRYLTFQYTDERTWGRRSLFYLNDNPISVCEVFLPETENH